MVFQTNKEVEKIEQVWNDINEKKGQNDMNKLLFLERNWNEIAF